MLNNISKTLQVLRLKSEEGIPIIVEGSNDIVSLRKIGVKGKILKLKDCNLSLYDFIYSLSSEKEAIILTDFDKEGDLLAAELSDELPRIGVKTDSYLRMKLKGLVKREVTGVEGISAYLERLNAETGKVQIQSKVEGMEPPKFKASLMPLKSPGKNNLN